MQKPLIPIKDFGLHQISDIKALEKCYCCSDKPKNVILVANQTDNNINVIVSQEPGVIKDGKMTFKGNATKFKILPGKYMKISKDGPLLTVVRESGAETASVKNYDISKDHGYVFGDQDVEYEDYKMWLSKN